MGKKGAKIWSTGWRRAAQAVSRTQGGIFEQKKLLLILMQAKAGEAQVAHGF